MQVADWRIEESSDSTEVSADIDGFRLWYRSPKPYLISRSGDPFLASALLPAMLKGERLEIDPRLPVSPKLLDNISRLQEIHNCWNPQFKIITIDAAKSPAEPLNNGTFSFFSGGIDSTYTFLKHINDISHLVFIHGFDFFLDGNIYKTAVNRNTRFAQTFEKKLIPIETNHHQFGYRYNLSRNLTQGSALASVAHLLGFPYVYVPASFSYNQLFPYGSHPLTDPIWSNECTTIVHDGAEARRVDKIERIVKCESALTNLRVCFSDMNVNCGKCSKCLRTMLPLKLLRSPAAPFPDLPLSDVFRKMSISNDIEKIFIEETVELAFRMDNNELRDALSTCLKKYERVRLFKEFDRVVLGGLIKRLYRAYQQIVKVPHGVPRIDTTPPKC
jgi:hypothetical protein